MEHLWKVVFLIVLFVFVPRWLWSQETKTKLALLKYKGGGDWYANPTSLPNLIRFCNDKLGTDLAKEPATVEPGSRDIFNYPYVHMTGHGNVVFTEVEAHKKCFLRMNWLRFPGNIRFLIRNINFRRDCPKFMSTMRNGRKLWAS